MKKRLDVIVFEKLHVASREKARAMVMAGEVLVNNQLVTKPGSQVHVEAIITFKDKPRFVSRGGEKLSGALTKFDLTKDAIDGAICADVGASTGGFTDCLLQNGAVRVYAIDVGYGQLAYSLRQDQRVVVVERTNARYLESLPERVSMVVIDASFISLRLLLPAITHWLAPQAHVIPLIKPQFEAGKNNVGKGGVVRDSRIHESVLTRILQTSYELGFTVWDTTTSPLKGPAGNIEFFALLRWGYEAKQDPPAIDALIAKAVH